MGVEVPVVELDATATDLGGGIWQIYADISNAHVAFYSYDDDGSGAAYVVRLGKNGSSFSATITGGAGNGVFVAQDEYFNTARAEVLNLAAIGLSTSRIDRTAHCGEEPDPNYDTFNIFNIGAGTLNYTIEVFNPPGWDLVDVHPLSGDSTGPDDQDLITVSYTCAGRAPGTYAATIRVVDPQAANSPKDLMVTVEVQTVRPDYNGDCDVDQEDFGHVQEGLDSAGVPMAPDCLDANLNDDSFVGQADVAILLNCKSTSGPNIIADQSCDDLP